MTKPKWYVVWQGRQPGIYTSWEEAKAQVSGFKGAKYQSFKTKWAAEEAFKVGDGSFIDIQSKYSPKIIQDSIAVDAACSGNPGLVEYQGVHVQTKEILFHKKIEGLGTNNCGEFLAIVHALAWQEKQKLSLPIYSDSDVALGWVKRKKCQTKLEKSVDTDPIYELICRAEAWLNDHQYTVALHKWITSEWGEIPADFGRK